MYLKLKIYLELRVIKTKKSIEKIRPNVNLKKIL